MGPPLQTARQDAAFPARGSRSALAPSILVVDDDTVTARTLEGILRGAGFRTSLAANLALARGLLESQPPDLVLLDLGLPDGSGLELCRQMQLQPRLAQVPVLFISSHEDVDIKVKAFDAGGMDYITKPVSGAEVLARVRVHLRLRQSYEALAEVQASRVNQLAAAQETTMPRPADLPEARFHAAVRQRLDAGGDFYDVIPTGQRVVDYLVADASGHDLAASFWTAAFKALVSQFASPVNAPLDVVRALNGALRRVLPAHAFFTVLYARLNRQGGRLTLVNAGHPPAVVVPARGGAQVVHQEGDVVGAFPDAVYGVTELPFKRGDRLYLYSDGLVERQGSRDAGTARLVQTCLARRTQELAQVVPAVVAELVTVADAADDVVLLGVDA